MSAIDDRPQGVTYENAPIPVIAANDVLVRMVAAAVSQGDWEISEGYLQQRTMTGKESKRHDYNDISG